MGVSCSSGPRMSIWPLTAPVKSCIFLSSSCSSARSCKMSASERSSSGTSEPPAAAAADEEEEDDEDEEEEKPG